jgi:hypothetical protein
MKKNLLVLGLVALTLSVQAQPLRKSVNANSSLKMGVQVENVGVNDQPVQMTKSRELVPAKVSAVVGGPGVSYTVPQGTLFQGLSKNFTGYRNTFAYTSPYINWTFTNKTTTSPTLLWTVSKYIDATTKIDSTATSVDLNMKVTTGSYYMPSLKGSANGLDSTFIFGTSFSSKTYASYIDAGGSAYTSAATATAPATTFNWTNWLYDFGQVTWTFAANDYAFGTGTGGTDALVSYYEKPQSTLYFEGAEFFLGAFSAPAGTTFTLRVITVTIDAQGKFTPKDTVATSHAVTEDVIVTAATAQVMPFTKLVTIDKDGFETEVPYLELNEPFFLELSGFNVPNVTLAMRSSRYDGGAVKLPYTNNHAFVYAPNSSGVRSLLSYTNLPATLETTITNAAYAYLLSDTKSIVANVAGGSANIVLEPYFGGVWVDGVLPSWITETQTDLYDATNWQSNAVLTYEALPVGVTGRSADVVFKTWGAQVTVHVSQGTVSGIPTVNVTKSKVYSTESSFELTYPGEFNNVSLIGLSGQVIGNYALPASGKFSISNAGISKGIYFLKFAGKEFETVKVVR